MTSYQFGRAYTGTLEKKNALGIWTKKYVSFTGTVMSISEKQGDEPTQKIDIGNVLRGGEINDPLVLVVATHGKSDEKTPFKAENADKAGWWYDLLRSAVEATERQKPRNAGLPDVDPRHGLAFAEIPPQFLAKFSQLDNAVLYWFSPVKKYGAKSMMGRHSTEDRLTFITDKCLFVTKPDSEVTRCMRVTLMTSLATNVDIVAKENSKDEVFLIVKMKEPDYDLYIASAEMPKLIRVLTILYKHLTKGRELPVLQVKTPTAEGVNMQLTRKGNFEMKVVVPLQKDALKQALDQFAAERGIVFNKSGQVRKAKTAEEQAASAASKTAASGGGAAGGATGAGAKQDKKRKLEPLDRFLGGLQLGKYADLLRKQQVDLDVLECMEEVEDFKNFGVKEMADIQLILKKLKDTDFMDKCRSAVKDEPAPAAAVAATPSGAPASKAAGGGAPAGGGKSVLDDSDDDLLGGTAGRGASPAGAGPSKPAFSLDDSDDDLLVMAPGAGNTGGGMRLSLDSDSDDDLLGGGGAAAKPASAAGGAAAPKMALSLDSDDDI